MPVGPCIVCGDTNYPLSFGGPGICPSCDCGVPVAEKRLRIKLTEALTRVYRLKRALVVAAIPLEVLSAAGELNEKYLCDELKQSIREGIAAVRKALSEDIDVATEAGSS